MDKVDCPFCRREIGVYQQGRDTPRGYTHEVRIRVHKDPTLKMRCPGSQKLLEDH